MNAFTRKLMDWHEKPLEYKLRSINYRICKIRDKKEKIFFERLKKLDFDGIISRDRLHGKSQFSVQNATIYGQITISALVEAIGEAERFFGKFDNFIDIGSGKGKACIYAARKFKFNKIIGIDFSKELTDIAKSNKQKLGARHQNIKFIHADATEWKIPEGKNLVFLYNPFNEKIMEKFISNNLEHFLNNDSAIAYVSDWKSDVLIRAGFETVFRGQEFRTSIYKMSVPSN